MKEKTICPASIRIGKTEIQCRKNQFLPQLQCVQEYFEKNLASRLMCSESTGIRISNVCWLVDMLFDSMEIQLVKKDFCEISGELVQFLSCDTSIWPEKKVELQLTLNI